MKFAMIALIFIATLVSASFVDKVAGEFGNLSAERFITLSPLYSAEYGDGFVVDSSDSTFTDDAGDLVWPAYETVVQSAFTLPSGKWIQDVTFELKVDAVGEDSISVVLVVFEMLADTTWGSLAPLITSSSNVVVGSYATYVFEFNPMFKVPDSGLYALTAVMSSDTTAYGMSYHTENSADYQSLSSRMSHHIASGVEYWTKKGADFYGIFDSQPQSARLDGAISVPEITGTYADPAIAGCFALNSELSFFRASTTSPSWIFLMDDASNYPAVHAFGNINKDSTTGYSNTRFEWYEYYFNNKYKCIRQLESEIVTVWEVDSLGATTTYPNNLRAGTFNFADATAVGGTANAITMDFVPDLLAVGAGTVIMFIAEGLNTGATSLAIDGGAAVDVYENTDVSACEGGEIVNGMAVQLLHDGTRWQIISNQP